MSESDVDGVGSGGIAVGGVGVEIPKTPLEKAVIPIAAKMEK